MTRDVPSNYRDWPDDIESSVRRHPASQGVQTHTPTDAEVIDLQTRRPEPDTVKAMGVLIVGSVGSDKESQMQMAADLAELISQIEGFSSKYVRGNPVNASNAIHVFECVFREDLIRINDKENKEN